MLSIKAVGFAIGLALVPVIALADFCNTLAGGAHQTCRVKVQAGGSVIFENWLRLAPERATQSSTGKKGYFVSGTTPAVSTLGTTTSKKPMLTIDCFMGNRSIRVGALPYMLGLANGSNKAFNLTFQIDTRTKFSERWSLDWKHAELKAPEGSQLANELQRSAKLTITTEGILGRNSQTGYVFDTYGFDQMNLGLCR
ncbi:hypothetical protein ACWGIE_07285 [Pseudomonas fulva]|uniref:hypothetical protein n=1 Tax=Pseudomonas fulva TaxID=47880 RepID=UPI000A81CA2D|nr:hypothetical protein [Pseudomonas fulva]